MSQKLLQHNFMRSFHMDAGYVHYYSLQLFAGGPGKERARNYPCHTAPLCRHALSSWGKSGRRCCRSLPGREAAAAATACYPTSARKKHAISSPLRSSEQQRAPPRRRHRRRPPRCCSPPRPCRARHPTAASWAPAGRDGRVCERTTACRRTARRWKGLDLVKLHPHAPLPLPRRYSPPPARAAPT